MSLNFNLLFSILKRTGNQTVYDVSISEDDLLTAAAVAVKEARSKLDVMIYVQECGSTLLSFKKRFGPIQFGFWNYIWTDSISEQDWNRIDRIKIMNEAVYLLPPKNKPTVMGLFVRDNLRCKHLYFCTNYKSKSQESMACSILQRCFKDIQIEYIKMEQVETVKEIPWDEFEKMKHTFLDKDGNFSIDLFGVPAG
ncbi:hypothetical protein L596_030912 [Steinernema carpocapsae]|uniref:Uncharacterized protein n=1 Tax=Steinernema carpocapsae TaxID=34508 RepID=A0A4U5MIH1_STECR|nr:hypothetical protein L596_030912 [Steinernema carpocapsae]